MRSIAARNTKCAGKGPERLEQRKNTSVLCSQPGSTRQAELPGGGCKAAALLHEPRNAFGGPEIGLIGDARLGVGTRLWPPGSCFCSSGCSWPFWFMQYADKRIPAMIVVNRCTGEQIPEIERQTRKCLR